MRRPRGLGTDIPAMAEHGTLDPSAPRPGRPQLAGGPGPLLLPSPGVQRSSFSVLAPSPLFLLISGVPAFPSLGLWGPPPDSESGPLLSLTLRPGFLLFDTSIGSFLVYFPLLNEFLASHTLVSSCPNFRLTPRDSQPTLHSNDRPVMVALGK